jgi:hypothetical protein
VRNHAPLAAQLAETQTHQVLGGQLLRLAVRPDLDPQAILADQME